MKDADSGSFAASAIHNVLTIVITLLVISVPVGALMVVFSLPWANAAGGCGGG